MSAQPEWEERGSGGPGLLDMDCPGPTWDSPSQHCWPRQTQWGLLLLLRPCGFLGPGQDWFGLLNVDNLMRVGQGHFPVRPCDPCKADH